MTTNLEVGTKVYYTGDMANSSGHFEVVRKSATDITIKELGEEGRTFRIYPSQVGDVYQGHCSPRFVTEEARQNFRKTRLSYSSQS